MQSPHYAQVHFGFRHHNSPSRAISPFSPAGRTLHQPPTALRLAGACLAFFGAAIVAVAHNRFWLLSGALSGFLVVAPVLATSLYALSRALERGEKADYRVVLKTWLNWQGSHFNKWGNDYWCMVQFGALLALAGTGWVVTSAKPSPTIMLISLRTPKSAR